MDRKFRIPSLDGLRAVAALMVFVAHSGQQDLVPGGFGVTIFFFLSGFLITTLLRRELEKTGRISLPKFYLRRVCRIFPSLYLVLGLLMLLAIGGVVRDGNGLARNTMTVAAIAAQVGHFTNYYQIFGNPSHMVPYTGAMWSLAVEEHFYFLFPAAMFLLSKRCNGGQKAAILAVTCGVVLAWRLYLVVGLGMDGDYTYYATDTRLDSLLYGCIMGVWCNPAMDNHGMRIGTRAWILLLSGSFVLLLISFLYRDPIFRETFRYSIQGVALFPIFFCAVRYSHWRIFSWLEFRVMRGLGLISYTFYLVHPACLGLSKTYISGNELTNGTIGFGAATVFSTATYFLIERHFEALRRKLHG